MEIASLTHPALSTFAPCSSLFDFVFLIVYFCFDDLHLDKRNTDSNSDLADQGKVEFNDDDDGAF